MAPPLLPAEQRKKKHFDALTASASIGSHCFVIVTEVFEIELRQLISAGVRLLEAWAVRTNEKEI
jgi:hypothetical protein